MATIKDVARIAGVSTSTVSHVLNKTRYVSDDVSKRVLQAVRELNYTPSSIARSLKVNQTKTLGMLVTTSKNPFFAEVVNGVERRCFQRGYTLFLCNTEGDASRMRTNMEMLLQKRVDGLLVMCSHTDRELFEIFDSLKSVPMVVMDWGPFSEHTDRIQDNSLYGGYLATKHLIEKGHTEIGCVTGPLAKQPARERLEGFRRAMEDNGIKVRTEWIVEGSFRCESGAEAMRAFLRMDKRPSGIFACNDMMAMGVIHEAVKAGLRLPGDLSVIGYDDIFLAQYTTPALTTIHQPKEKLGAMAVDTLLERLIRKGSDGKTINLEPHLIERDSVTQPA